MYQYWTFWNFGWYLSSEIGLFSLNGPLRTSIINTSILGGFMTYIYPGKIIIKKEKKKDDETTIQYKYILPFYQGAILDFIFHQVPLIRLWFIEYQPGTCGFYTMAPTICWFFLNCYKNINLDRIYGIKMKHICLSSAIISSIFGFYQHKKLLNK
jgi:hypothetical protein